MASTRIRYLASIIAALKVACKFLPLASQTIRPRVPSENLAAYDAGVAATQAFCDLLQVIDYTDDNIGTN